VLLQEEADVDDDNDDEDEDEDEDGKDASRPETMRRPEVFRSRLKLDETLTAAHLFLQIDPGMPKG